MQIFLELVDNNYIIKFKNNIFDKEIEQTIFEDYNQFLISYHFDGKDLLEKVNFWKETFVPLTMKEKLEIIELNNNKSNTVLIYELKDKNLIIKQKGQIKDEIKEIDIYVFSNLDKDLNAISDI